MPSIQGDQEAGGGHPGPQDTQESPIVPARRWWRRRRTLVAAAAVVLAAGAGLGTWLATSGGGTPRAQTGFVVVTRTVRVTTGTMSETVGASGTIQPAQTADLDFTVSGRVSAVDVAVGDTVTTGQVLATVAPTALDAQEAAAESTLSSDEARLAADQSSGAATTQITADQAAVASAQTALTTAKKSLAGAVLTSTITGVVSNVDLTVGDQVSGSGGGGSSSTPAHVFGPGAGTSGSDSQVTVVSPNRFIVNCSVDDVDVSKLADGDRAIVTQTGTPVSVPGTITFVSLVPSGTGIPSYPVTVTLTGTPGGIFAGTNARLSLVVKRLRHVVEVPTPAVSYRGGHPTVEVKLAGGGHETRSVTVGTTLNGETEITKGLTAGQLVVERVETFRSSGTTRGARSKHTGPVGRRIVTGFVGSAPLQVSGG